MEKYQRAARTEQSHVFDLKSTEFNSVVIYLRYAFVAFKISSPHNKYKSMLITNAKLHELHARFFSPVFWIGFDQCSIKALQFWREFMWIEQTQNNIVWRVGYQIYLLKLISANPH